MPDDVTMIPAVNKRMLLESMLHGPAFALFCDKWNEKLEILQDKINDPATNDQETRELKLVRRQCAETNHPRKIVEAMLRTLGAEKQKTK
jgi:hypothetical protein